jgi:GNAT superfamily N-acetyltransferase
MATTQFREAAESDIPALARLRAAEWESEQYWTKRITAYMRREAHPQKALMARMIYVAVEDDTIIGFVAGHLTRRFECDAELQWIDVIRSRRGAGLGAELVRQLAPWFLAQNARRICVDPGNPKARRFYERIGAVSLNKHWLVWEDISVVLRRGTATPNP